MKTTICVLEDNEVIIEMIELILIDQGFEVKKFISKAEFDDYLISSVPELIILDIHLPDGNGVEICRVLRSNDLYNHVPILMMSADHNANYLTDQYQMIKFIEKPFEIEAFVKCILELLAHIDSSNYRHIHQNKVES